MEGLTYYAVSGGKEVFLSREEALALTKKLSKTDKTARFKGFATREEAEIFANTVEDVVDGGADASSSSTPAESDPGACKYPKPTNPALNAFRIAMERDDGEKVRSLLAENTRYLIECSADLPVLLQKGCHYNALHVCSRKNRVGMARLVLDTITSDDFWRRTYPNDSDEVMDQRRDHLLDLYLHSYDKGRGYTALHFASDMGYPGVLEVLLSSPKADLKVLSRDGQSIGQVVCEHFSGGDIAKEQARSSVMELLEGQFYVPILRPEDDDALPAILGKPFSPSQGGSPLSSIETTPVKAGPSSPLTLNAIAGPMSPSRAREFYSSLKRPRHPAERQARSSILRSDSGRGLERLGRDLARRHGVNWQEKWSFLNEECNFATESGLQKLETFFIQRESDLKQLAAEHIPTTPTPHSDSTTDFATPGSDRLPTNDSQESPASGDSVDGQLERITSNLASSSLGDPNPTISVGDAKRDECQVTPPCSLTSSQPPTTSHDTVDGRLDQITSKLGAASLEETPPSISLDKSPGDAAASLGTPSGPTPSSRDWGAEVPTYISGFDPSKDDQDVLLAIGDMTIDSSQFPHVAAWYRRATHFSSDVRQKWRTPTKLRSRGRFIETSPRMSPLSAAACSPLSRPRNPGTGRALLAGSGSPRLQPSPGQSLARTTALREQARTGQSIPSPSKYLDFAGCDTAA